MKPVVRTWISVGLFVPLAAILLATFACLPAPVGEPDKSKVDPALSGIYRLQVTDPEDKTSQIAMLRPWDDHCYLLEYITTGVKDGKEVRKMEHFKCWLTTLSDKTFLTAEPLDNQRFAWGDDGSQPVWVVLRLDKVEGGLEVRMVNPDGDFVKGLTKREELENAIKAHASDQPLYTDALTYKKLTKENQAVLDEALSKFNTERPAK